MALTKVSRGLLSTGIVDNSNATAITLNADESATFAAGIDVAGALTGTSATFTVADNSDNLTLTSTDTDDNSGPNVRLYRNSGSPGDNYVLGQIDFEGKNDASQDVRYGFISAKISDASDGTEDGQLRFFTIKGGTETQTMTLESGNLLVGKTASGTANTGAELRDGLSNHAVVATASSEAPVAVNRRDNDGVLINLYRNQASVGSISTLGGDFVVGSSSGSGAALRMDGTNNQIYPSNASGSARDGDVSLGASSVRFKDLYLSGGINFNGSSGGINTANRSFLMDEYEIGTCTISFSTSGGGATLSRQDNATGYYQKTGDICTVQFYSGVLTFSNAGSGSARIHGLPFNSRGGTYNYGVCSITHSTATTTAIQNGFTTPNLSHISLMQANTTSGAVWATGGVRYLMFSVTYLTT